MATDPERIRWAEFYLVAPDEVLDRLATDPKYVNTKEVILDLLDKASLFGDYRPETLEALCRKIRDMLWDGVLCSHRVVDFKIYFFVEEIPQDVFDSTIFYTPNSTGLH